MVFRVGRREVEEARENEGRERHVGDDDQVCVVSGGNARCCPEGTKFGTLLVKLITAKDTYL